MIPIATCFAKPGMLVTAHMVLNRKIFTTLFFSIFATVTGVGIVVPLLPVYAHNMGAGGLYIGLIFGAFSLSRTCFLPFFGRFSDRNGRKPYIVAGLLAYALLSAAFIIWKDVPAFIVIRFLQGIASAMIMPVTQAYIGDLTPAGREGFTMGLFNMSIFFGLSIGPLAGGIINRRLGIDPAFACMGLLAFASFLLSLVLLPPVRLETVYNRTLSPPEWKWMATDREILALFVFRLGYTTCIGIIWGFLPVLADTAFSLSSAAIGVLVMLGVFTSGLLHAPMGFLADRANKPAMVLSGGLITSLAIYAFVWARGFGELFAANVLFGIGGGLSMPALMALAVIRGNRTSAMGSIMALLTVAHSAGMILGALLGGLAMDLWHLRRAFSLGAGSMLLASIFFYRLMPRRPSQRLPGN